MYYYNQTFISIVFECFQLDKLANTQIQSSLLPGHRFVKHSNFWLHIWTLLYAEQILEHN